MQDSSVCACFKITEENVREDFKEDMSIDDLIEASGIGGACNCCTRESCGKVDVNIHALYRELTKN